MQLVKAVDGDRGINNRISYAITRGGAGVFGIDSSTGIVYNLRPLDREDPRNSNGAYILEITVSACFAIDRFLFGSTHASNMRLRGTRSR
jgi:hypothetical protein